MHCAITFIFILHRAVVLVKSSGPALENKFASLENKENMENRETWDIVERFTTSAALMVYCNHLLDHLIVTLFGFESPRSAAMLIIN